MFFKKKTITIEDKIKGAIIGACVGDCIGVPFEFMERDEIQKYNILKPSTRGNHNQEIGTWSDDSSMIFCTMESLCRGYNYKDIGDTFVKWAYESYWTPNGIVFDVGGTTANALRLIRSKKQYTGINKFNHCGNGSLMRIIPLLFYIHKNKKQRFKIIQEVSSLTHSHPICIIGCAIYIEFALNILEGQAIEEAYKNMQDTICDIYDEYPEALNKYQRILFKEIDFLKTIDKNLLSGSGYIVDTLETALYSFLSTSNYKESICTAISIGKDTDTTACIVGGLSGMYYGFQSIPIKLKKNIKRKDDIDKLTCDFINAYLNDFL